MSAITRITDETIGICNIGALCCPHSRNGINVTGSPNVFSNTLKVHRVTDKGNCRCPHSGIYTSTEGSPNVFVNLLAITRIGDTTICDNCGMPGKHSTGSLNVFAN